MADARQRFWHRVGPATVATSALLVGLAAPGCDGGKETTSSGGSGGSAGSTAGNAGTGGTGGSTAGSSGNAGTGGSAGSDACGSSGTSLNAVPQADAHNALDATPDSKGQNTYYTATPNGEPGIFKVGLNADCTGGTVTPLYQNDAETGKNLLAAPFGISIDSADKAVYVADTGYDVTPGDPETAIGAILTIGTDPGTPTVVTGTEGYKPRGLDIHMDSEGDTIYFTGAEPMSGTAGLFSRLVSGGGVTKVATGAPFVNPSGVAVAKDRIFVTDALASDERLASVILVQNGAATSFVDGIGIGYPAGVALSADEKTLFVSGIDLVKGNVNVLVIDIATKAITPFIGQGLNENVDAGGLHRARGTDVFTWAGLTAGPAGGTVYRLNFK